MLIDEGNSGRRIVIVDDDPMFQDLIVARLIDAGWEALPVREYEEAVALLNQQGGVDAVLLDHVEGTRTLIDTVQAIRKIRAETAVIGNSGGDRQAEFADAGVGYFLHKPWRLPDLLHLLERRIAKCIECGLPLPLRHPDPGEVGTSWACAFCQARYYGVVDVGAAPELRANVQPISH